MAIIQRIPHVAVEGLLKAGPGVRRPGFKPQPCFSWLAVLRHEPRLLCFPPFLCPPPHLCFLLWEAVCCTRQREDLGSWAAWACVLPPPLLPRDLGQVTWPLFLHFLISRKGKNRMYLWQLSFMCQLDRAKECPDLAEHYSGWVCEGGFRWD